jgi:hypothetical protein
VHVVRDGQRELQFDGTLLSSSSSRRGDSPRWVEFELYRTSGGQYVLARVGRSNCYHRPDCAVVSRNRIELSTRESLGREATACRDCWPDPSVELVAPEQPRFWAQVSESPNGVVQSLYKYDSEGTRYLTYVAKRLLSDAARQDDDLRDIFYREHVA